MITKDCTQIHRINSCIEINSIHYSSVRHLLLLCMKKFYESPKKCLQESSSLKVLSGTTGNLKKKEYIMSVWVCVWISRKGIQTPHTRHRRDHFFLVTVTHGHDGFGHGHDPDRNNRDRESRKFHQKFEL